MRSRGLFELGRSGGRFDQNILDVLLSKRGTTLRDAAALLVRQGSPQESAVVDAVVLIEAPVFDGDDGVAHRHRDVIERDGDPVFGAVQGRQAVTVFVQDHGTLGKRRLHQRRRQLIEEIGAGLCSYPDTAHEGQHHHRE